MDGWMNEKMDGKREILLICQPTHIRKKKSFGVRVNGVEWVK